MHRCAWRFYLGGMSISVGHLREQIFFTQTLIHFWHVWGQNWRWKFRTSRKFHRSPSSQWRTGPGNLLSSRTGRSSPRCRTLSARRPDNPRPDDRKHLTSPNADPRWTIISLFCITLYCNVSVYQVPTIFRHNRWSSAVPYVSNRMKRSNLQKRDKTFLFWRGGGKKEFLHVVAKLQAKSQKPWKSLCPTVLQLGWVISTWWDENMTLFVFSACYEMHWNWFCGRKQTKNAKDQKRSIFFAKGTVIEKSVFQTKRINAVHGWCSSSGVLRHIPSNFTRSVRRWIVLQFLALSCGVDMLPWPKVPSKWAGRLGQVHCQYGTFAKLRASCPFEVVFEVVMFLDIIHNPCSILLMIICDQRLTRSRQCVPRGIFFWSDLACTNNSSEWRMTWSLEVEWKCRCCPKFRARNVARWGRLWVSSTRSSQPFQNPDRLFCGWKCICSNWTINQSTDQSINQSTNQSINQAINQSIHQSINGTINGSINPWINQSINGRNVNPALNYDKKCIWFFFLFSLSLGLLD